MVARRPLGRLGLTLAILLIGCTAGNPAPTTTRLTPGPSVPAPTAAPTPAARPSPEPTPAAPPSPVPTASAAPAVTPTWQTIGTIPAKIGVIQSATGFAKGYVALEPRADSVWFSADGRSWRSVKLPFEITRDSYGNTLRAAATAVTSNGAQVLVVGGYDHKPCRRPAGDTGAGLICPQHPIAWISDDGLTWRSAYPGPKPSTPAGYDQGSEFVAAWPVPTGGWDAALSFWEGESLTGRDLWHSGDGIAWTRFGRAPGADVGGVTEFPFVHAGAADSDGRRVVWQGWPRGDSPAWATTLATTTDGTAWRQIVDVAGPGANITAGIGPADVDGPWVLVGGAGIGEDWSSSVPTVWTSRDAIDWTATPLPFVSRCAEDEEECGGALVTSVALAQTGYVAGAAALTWWSADAREWSRLPDVADGANLGPGVVAAGPRGVIGIGPGEDADVTVWQLR